MHVSSQNCCWTCSLRSPLQPHWYELLMVTHYSSVRDSWAGMWKLDLHSMKHEKGGWYGGMVQVKTLLLDTYHWPGYSIGHQCNKTSTILKLNTDFYLNLLSGSKKSPPDSTRHGAHRGESRKKNNTASILVLSMFVNNAGDKSFLQRQLYLHRLISHKLWPEWGRKNVATHSQRTAATGLPAEQGTESAPHNQRPG